MHFFQRFLLLILFALIFFYVVQFIEPPKSWPEANTFQILVFFLPLLGTITCFINIFIRHILGSFVAALGLIFALVLLAINQLTPLSSAITFFITGLIFAHTPSVHYFHTRKLKKITNLAKNNSKKEEDLQKVLKKL